jgi:hypothetical protein
MIYVDITRYTLTNYIIVSQYLYKDFLISNLNTGNHIKVETFSINRGYRYQL